MQILGQAYSERKGEELSHPERARSSPVAYSVEVGWASTERMPPFRGFSGQVHQGSDPVAEPDPDTGRITYSIWPRFTLVGWMMSLDLYTPLLGFRENGCIDWIVNHWHIQIISKSQCVINANVLYLPFFITIADHNILDNNILAMAY